MHGITIDGRDVLELDFVKLGVKVDLLDALATAIHDAMIKIAEYAWQEGAEVMKKTLVDALDTAMEDLPSIHQSATK